MFKYSYKRGFTLIELLVVIAIIGILASVVLASLNSARSKGSDAAVKSNLNGVRTQAEIVYDNASPNSYTGLCTNTNVVDAINAAKTAGGDTRTVAQMCGAGANAWAVSAQLRTTNQVSASSGTDWWCVDSTGKSMLRDTAPANSATSC